MRADADVERTAQRLRSPCAGEIVLSTPDGELPGVLRAGPPWWGSHRRPYPFQRWAPLFVILHYDHLAVAHAQHLEQLHWGPPGGIGPAQPDDHAGGVRGDHFCADVRHAVVAQPLNGVMEDRPGLVRPVSAGCAAPPQMSTRGAPPLHVWVQQRDEFRDVARHCGVVGRLDSLRSDRRHLTPVCMAHRDATAVPAAGASETADRRIWHVSRG